MNKRLILIGCLVMLLSACQPNVIQVVSVSDENKTRENISTIVSSDSKTSIDAVCGVGYQNNFVLGETSYSDAIEHLHRQNMTFQIDADGNIVLLDPEGNFTTLLFHEGTLYGIEIWRKSSPFLLKQIIDGLGEPEYIFVSSGHNITPVGGCEGEKGTWCAVAISLLYPDKGVEFISLFGTDEKMITFRKDTPLETAVCFQPGKYQTYQKYRFGEVANLTNGLHWEGFGMTVPVSLSEAQ